MSYTAVHPTYSRQSMVFPVYLGVWAFKLHPHFVFEVVAYGVAMGLLRRNVTNDAIPLSQRSSVVVGGLIGALVGAKLLLLGCHTVAGALIFLLGLLVAVVGIGDYAFVVPWVIGAAGFLFWQLLYVIPLIITLRRRGHIAMSKGVIIAAVLTALVNGACFVSMFGFV